MLHCVAGEGSDQGCLPVTLHHTEPSPVNDVSFSQHPNLGGGGLLVLNWSQRPSVDGFSHVPLQAFNFLILYTVRTTVSISYKRRKQVWFYLPLKHTGHEPQDDLFQYGPAASPDGLVPEQGHLF